MVYKVWSIGAYFMGVGLFIYGLVEDDSVAMWSGLGIMWTNTATLNRKDCK